jgi:hypothetical protein
LRWLAGARVGWIGWIVSQTEEKWNPLSHKIEKGERRKEKGGAMLLKEESQKREDAALSKTFPPLY